MSGIHCEECGQDHSKKLEKWCDRSELEIENDALRDLLLEMRKALEFEWHHMAAGTRKEMNISMLLDRCGRILNKSDDLEGNKNE